MGRSKGKETMIGGDDGDFRSKRRMAMEQKRKAVKEREERDIEKFCRVYDKDPDSYVWDSELEDSLSNDDDDFEVEKNPSSSRRNPSTSEPVVSDVDGGKNIGGSGPEDTSVLTSFTNHIARSIWDLKEERGPLRCISHWRKLREWKVEEEPDEVIQRVRNSGLYNIIEYSYGWMDIVSISAFVERWQPETNSFHMPFGEITITLDDVAQILRIPIMGKPLYYQGGGRDIGTDDLLDLFALELGIEVDVSKAEMMGTYTIRLNWLKENFLAKSTEDSSAEDLDVVARSYLLYALGCCVFPDKSGTKMSAYYINALKGDLGKVGENAWGMSILAYLYRQLGLASRRNVKQISGCMSLLMAWIYEHFPMIPNATPNPLYDESMPRLCKWKNSQFGGDQRFTLIKLREQLDALTERDVIWNPYMAIRDRYPLQESAFYNGILLCFDIGEPYYPNRVLRQFDRVQVIPNPPRTPNTFTRGATFNQYKIRYDNGYWSTQNWEDHILSDRSTPVAHPWDCHKSYMSWYASVSHPIIQNPCARITPCVKNSVDSSSRHWVEAVNRTLRLIEENLKGGSLKDQKSRQLQMKEILMKALEDGKEVNPEEPIVRKTFPRTKKAAVKRKK